MYQHRLAYRHENGEIEGFLGTGSTKAVAKTKAIARASRKADQLDQAFDKGRLIEQVGRLSREELDQVQADWRLEETIAHLDR